MTFGPAPATFNDLHATSYGSEGWGSRSLRLEACRAIGFCHVFEEPAVYSQVNPESGQGL